VHKFLRRQIGACARCRARSQARVRTNVFIKNDASNSEDQVIRRRAAVGTAPLAFIAIVLVVVAGVGIVSLTSQTALLTATSTQTTSTANATSSALSSTTSCPPITWANVTGTASISYEPVVQQIVQDPSFTALTHGLCYSFALTDYGKVLNTAQWENFTNFVFDHFNGTIIYPCGVFPAKLLVSQIQVSTVLNGTTLEKIASVGLNNDTYDLEPVRKLVEGHSQSGL
jgi:hypothetical protein